MSGDELQRKNLTVAEARARMLAGAGRLGVEEVVLAKALGRVLAAPVVADRHQPPFDASAMDGWAIRRADLAPGARFWVAGESAAGQAYARPVEAGQAVRIFTGAPVPPGADLVVIQENAARDGDTVAFTIDRDPPPGNIRPAGGDFRSGDTLLAEGARLDAWRLALAAAAGWPSLDVAVRPRVAILATGDELVPPGYVPAPDQIFESGSFALAALVEAWGGQATRLKAQADDRDAIAAAVADAPFDLLVTVGGASVGDHDLVKPALETLGLDLRVQTVAVRPGKPTWFGTLDVNGAGDRRVLGLPGNPASALVCAELFLRPLLAALTGADPALPITAGVLAQPLPANGPREHWMRAACAVDAEGRVQVTPFPDQDSSLIGVFSRADCLVMRPAGAPAAGAGEVVQLLPLARG
ncbi:gephyrin-like molybdotransferase Glp [Caulobacter sp. BE254]|uniref:molybdopterin molybdotransferase MoeA n=1 Tax=Caulobacter sp. BE254 TaxID=2817720 RepID=UPI002860A77D|nr:gephyrin-like molybdotransferase Glp [Caulobacter sp. BE254]MDR7118509.1 molybdopterin molybdotransferase [Caulobacter sp. BE254]